MNSLPQTHEFIYPSKLACRLTPLNQEKVRVIYSDNYSRKSNPDIDGLIRHKRQYLLDNSHGLLHPALKFRLFFIDTDDQIICHVGVTDYLEYLCTNYDKALNRELIKRGVEDFGAPDAYLSNAIGNLAVAVTLDGKIPILIRSSKVATFSGFYDLPGGHPEPIMVNGYPRFTEQSVDDIRDELFDSIKREISGELNINESDIQFTKLLGIIRNLEDGRKPEMIFYTPLNITSQDLLRLYLSGGEEAEESVALEFIDPPFQNSLDIKMTVPTQVALELYDGLTKGNPFS